MHNVVIRIDVQLPDVIRSFEEQGYCVYCQTAIRRGDKYCGACKCKWKEGRIMIDKPSAKGESGPEVIYPLTRQAEINDMPRIWRDTSKCGTWIDGEFVEDRQLLSYLCPYLEHGLNSFTTAAEGASRMLAHFGQEFTFNDKDWKLKPVDPRVMYNPKRWAIWDSTWPTKKSRIGSVFYLGAMVCSRLLRKWLIRSTHTPYALKQSLLVCASD